MADPLRRFAFRLAWYSGRIEVDKDVLDVLTREQLLEWMAFLELEPPGPDRDDVRQAFHAAKNLNQWIGGDGEKYTVSELMVDWTRQHEPKPEPTPEERELAIQAAILSSFR